MSPEAPDPRELHDPEEVLAVILDPERRGTLYPYYHRLRELDPVHRTDSLLLRRAWVLTRYEDVNAVFRHAGMNSDTRAVEIFDTGEGGRQFYEMMTKLLLYLEPEVHDRIRALVSRAFTPRSVSQRIPRIQREVDRLLDAAEDAGKMDGVHDFAYPLPIAVICDMMGIPAEDVPLFFTWAHDFARRGDVSGVTESTVAKGEAATVGFRDYFLAQSRDRRRHPGDDLITALVQVEDESGGLSDEEVVATCVILLQAGHETTADLIGMATSALLHHPDQLALLRAEPQRIGNAVEEFIRFDTSVQISQRVGPRDLRLGDVVVPAGDVCVLINGAANRDPARYPEPDRLDLRRRDTAHLSFGLGNHVCLGASLARAEIRSAVGTLALRFPKLELAGEPSFRPSLYLRGLASLPLHC